MMNEQTPHDRARRVAVEHLDGRKPVETDDTIDVSALRRNCPSPTHTEILYKTSTIVRLYALLPTLTGVWLNKGRSTLHRSNSEVVELNTSCSSSSCAE